VERKSDIGGEKGFVKAERVRKMSIISTEEKQKMKRVERLAKQNRGDAERNVAHPGEKV